MKTAMQELLKHFIDEWSSPSDYWNPSKVIDKVESMIEKEKEQIIKANRQGRCNDCPIMYSNEEAQEYYNQTYNQNK